MFSTIAPVIIFLFLIGHQICIRWEMEDKLEHEHLTIITLDAADFKWHKQGKEIVINGQLFDVKSIEKLNNHQLVITGLYDYQEQELLEDMDKMPGQNANADTTKLIHQMLALIATEPDNKPYISFLSSCDIQTLTFYDGNLINGYFSVIIPPPKACKA